MAKPLVFTLRHGHAPWALWITWINGFKPNCGIEGAFFLGRYYRTYFRVRFNKRADLSRVVWEPCGLVEWCPEDAPEPDWGTQVLMKLFPRVRRSVMRVRHG